MANANQGRSKDFYSAGKLKTDIWFKIASKDYEELLAKSRLGELITSGNIQSMLDVGCGTGKFPVMLSKNLPAGIAEIAYDYLDPSEHSLAQLKANLQPPFASRTPLQTTLEDLDTAALPPYDIVWAVHSLYVVDRTKLPESVAAMEALVKDHGELLIYHASEPSFYHRFYSAYIEGFGKTDQAPYITAEEMLALFSLPIEHLTFEFDHVVEAGQEDVLEYYLQQMCFDNSLTMDDFLSKEPTRRLIEEGKQADGSYRFRQIVFLMGRESVLSRVKP